jgi:predicted ATPase/class 3 adenylate cyclase/DNA-binding response OmpR family regulator
MLKYADCLLVVSEQASLRATIARLVVRLGYRVEIASSEKSARQLIAQGQFAGAIVAPEGLVTRESAFLRELQGAVPKLAVLTDDANAAKRFTASFPDAVVCRSEPLEHEKLLAFLSESSPQASYSAGTLEHLYFAGCRLDVTGRIFLNAERQEVPLTRGEFGLLVAFARNYGRVLSRNQLRNAMDGGSAESYERSIDMLVARLRRKVEPNPAKPQFILTVPGVGYKFIPHVRCGQPATAAPPASRDTGQVPGAAEAPRSERRQVTVLSCQILGFAALAAKLDPEDLDGAIGPVYAACDAVITRFGGTVVRTLGDSTLSYFGYPKAHEDDATRAVRSALEMLRSIRKIEATLIGNFRARIGIATGLMLVGEPRSIGSRDAGGMGEALNLALHMQRAVPAEAVVISATTHNLIGRLFECREVPPVKMEDEHDGASAWEVIAESASIPRFDALRRDAMSEFVGRDAEINRLQQCWTKARSGSTQVVLLLGEPGIGKSRLLIELQQRLDAEHAIIQWSGSQHRADMPMSVLVDELQASARFNSGDSAGQKLAKLQQVFATSAVSSPDSTALVAGLLEVPCEVPPQISQLAPQRRKERTFAALLDRIEGLAAQQTVFAVMDDAHWADPSSLEFLSLLVERASTWRLMLLVVARTEFALPWPEHPSTSTLVLPRLSRVDSVRLVQRTAGERRIPQAIEAEIVARADGIPLFLEEVTKSVLESSASDCDVGSFSGSHRQTIPATLQALLLARLDRLGRGKEVAQIAAVIGREFSFDILKIIGGIEEKTLIAALDELVKSGLMFRRGLAPHGSFVFKHALVRDAAYEMRIRANRQKLHGEVARCYEEHFPEIAETQPELLAYHFRQAGNPIKSANYLLVAAQRALLSSASAETLAHLTLARELITSLPESSERLRLQLQLEVTFARTLLATSGYTDPETRAAYRRARQCCEALGDQHFLPLTMHGQWICAWVGADHEYALQQARQLYAWGERNNDLVGLAVAHSDLGLTLTNLGRLTEARDHLAQALRINKFVLPGRQPFIASDADGRISTLSFMQHCLLLLGFPDQANEVAIEAASLRPHNLYSRALAQTRLLRMYVFARDTESTERGALELLQLAQQQGYPYFIATANVYTGWARAQHGDVERGIQACQQGLAQLRAIGIRSWLPFYVALLAECYAQNGDYALADEAVTDALQAIEATGERVWEAEILRLKGNLLMRRRSDGAAAEACFTAALEVTRLQKAKLLELRAAMSLATLSKIDYQVHRAKEVLASVYYSFSEGFDFVDLREAKLLLEGFGSRTCCPPPS